MTSDTSGLIAAFRAWHESDPRPPLEDFLARALTLQGVPTALAIGQSPELPKQTSA